MHEDIHHLLFVQWIENIGVNMRFEFLLDLREAHPAW